MLHTNQSSNAQAIFQPSRNGPCATKPRLHRRGAPLVLTFSRKIELSVVCACCAKRVPMGVRTGPIVPQYAGTVLYRSFWRIGAREHRSTEHRSTGAPEHGAPEHRSTGLIDWIEHQSTEHRSTEHGISRSARPFSRNLAVQIGARSVRQSSYLYFISADLNS